MDKGAPTGNYFMQVLPTYEVITDPDLAEPIRRRFRVPQAELEAFLRVLLFNGSEDIRVMREDMGHGR